MTMKTVKLALAAVAVLGIGAVSAQEMGTDTPAKSPAAAAQPQNQALAPAAVPAAIPTVASVPGAKSQNDPGPKIVAESQQWKSQIQETKVDQETASEKVQRALQKNGMTQGFVPGSRAIIQIGVANDTIKDIGKSAAFMKIREGLAREAILNARVQIVRAIRQKMSAGESIIESDSLEFDQYKEKHAEEYAELERQKEKVAALLKMVDEAEADTLAKRSLEDDWDAIVSGIIKRIDETYDPNKVSAEKKARYLEVKSAYEAAKQKLDALKKAYESDPIGKNIADVKACFDLPLYGLTVIYQAESYSENGQYQIACAAVWSPKLQERALMTLSGQKQEASAPGKMSLANWLKEKDESKAMAAMVGSRQYIDDKGVQYVLGFAALELPKNARNRQRSQEKADLEAERVVLSALFEQASGTKSKHDELLMYAGNDEAQRETDALGAYAKVLNGKTPERPVSGLMKVYGARFIHPFTGKEIYVSVASVDNQLAFASEGLLNDINAAAVRDTVHTQYVEGQEAARKQVLDHAKKSDAAFQKGAQDATAAAAELLTGQQPAAVVPTAPNAQQAPAPRRRTGVISGDEAINADF